jgi:hypothetical protein
VFDRKLEEPVVNCMDRSSSQAVRFLDNPEIRDVITRLIRDQVYDRIQDQSKTRAVSVSYQLLYNYLNYITYLVFNILYKSVQNPDFVERPFTSRGKSPHPRNPPQTNHFHPIPQIGILYLPNRRASLKSSNSTELATSTTQNDHIISSYPR